MMGGYWPGGFVTGVIIPSGFLAGGYWPGGYWPDADDIMLWSLSLHLKLNQTKSELIWLDLTFSLL